MEDVDSLEQLFDNLFRLGQRSCSFPIGKLIGEHLVTELKNAVNLFRPRVFVLQNVQKPHELFVVDKLSEQGNFSHG